VSFSAMTYNKIDHRGSEAVRRTGLALCAEEIFLLTVSLPHW
jgi:hypothetical protein